MRHLDNNKFYLCNMSYTTAVTIGGGGLPFWSTWSVHLGIVLLNLCVYCFADHCLSFTVSHFSGFRMEVMFGSSLPSVVCGRDHVCVCA